MATYEYLRFVVPGQVGPEGLEVDLSVQRPAEGVCTVTWRPDRGATLPCGFVLAHVRHAEPTWLEAADVLVEEPATATVDRDGVGEQWLARYPGCVLVVVPTSVGAAELHTRARRPHRVHPRADVRAGWRCAVLGGWWVLSGWPLATLTGDHGGELPPDSILGAVMGGCAGGRFEYGPVPTWDDQIRDTAPRPSAADPGPW